MPGQERRNIVVATFAAVFIGGTHLCALVSHAGTSPDHLIEISVHPEGSGITTGEGSYVSGSDIALRAEAMPGYLFACWTEGGSVVSINSDYAFTASRDRTLVANFAEAVIPEEAPLITGHLTGYRSRTYEIFRFTVVGTTDGSVWGTDLYTDDSRLGKAAVHAGLIDLGETNVVALMMLPGANSYQSSTRNGITTSSWGSWYASYKFISTIPEIVGISMTEDHQIVLRWTGGDRVSLHGTTNLLLTLDQWDELLPNTLLNVWTNPSPDKEMYFYRLKRHHEN